MFYLSKKVRLFSQNDVLFLFYFLINPTMTTDIGNLSIFATKIAFYRTLITDLYLGKLFLVTSYNHPQNVKYLLRSYCISRIQTILRVYSTKSVIKCKTGYFIQKIIAL